jgi:glutamine amidotransferase
MCELFGITSREGYEINNYLKEFYARSSAHPHGWGFASMNKNMVAIEKEPIQASKSHYLKQRLSVPIRVKNAFAHIRYATIGNIEYRNCHPYTKKDISGRQWTMIHNGTIFEYEPLNKYVKIQMGDTDSERILLYIVEQVEQKEKKLKRKLEKKERFQLIDSIMVEMSKGNKLNLMLYDGELFYVHTNYQGSLHELKKKDTVLFSTAPLSKEEWTPVTFTTLLAYEKGKQVFQGTNHGNEYVDSAENMEFLYRIFAAL